MQVRHKNRMEESIYNYENNNGIKHQCKRCKRSCICSMFFLHCKKQFLDFINLVHDDINADDLTKEEFIQILNDNVVISKNSNVFTSKQSNSFWYLQWRKW